MLFYLESSKILMEFCLLPQSSPFFTAVVYVSVSMKCVSRVVAVVCMGVHTILLSTIGILEL